MPESNTPSSKLSEEPPSGLSIEIVNRQDRHRVDESRLCEAARMILVDAGFQAAQLSLAIVDDAEMHLLNRQYLAHDYPTDVLSFLLEADDESLEGEIIVSADTARREAEQWKWTLDDELLLYIIHGSLHLIGLDDHTEEDRQQMRQYEARYLERFGLQHRYEGECREGANDSSKPGPGATS